MAATIKDIARISGFGVGTVSRVLNGSPRVSPETRARVLEVARELRYRPNKLAKMLVTGRFPDTTIGIILPLITHRFSLEIIGGIYSGLSRSGYNLLVFNLGKDREQVFEHIRYSHFAGLLALLDPLKSEEKQMLEEHHSRFIYLDYHEQGESSIHYDHFRGGGLAASYLLHKNCRNILFVGDRADTQQRRERLEGFKDALSGREGISLREVYVEHDEEAAYAAALREIHAGRVEGIFFYCDDLALGGLRAKRDSGSSIRIVGYDDIQAAGYLGLSTVRQDGDRLGRLGARQIVELVRAEAAPHEPVSLTLQPELIDRNS